MKKVFAAMVLACGLLALSAGAGATAIARHAALAELEIVDAATGAVLPTWLHQGRRYVAGTPGQRFAVRLRNRSAARLLMVLSVDGVNAVSGATAAIDQPGYVLDGRRSADIRGWRKSLDQVAAFYFTNPAQAYATRTDRPENLGVIGVALFPERAERIIARPRLPLEQQRENREATAAGPLPAPLAADSARAAEKLGTGHGERLADAVGETPFERASTVPAGVLTIYYDTRENLQARGVLPRAADEAHWPQAFPGRFVPDPPQSMN